MTQTELSRGFISVSYLSKIENGYMNPPAEIIRLLNERLKINSHSKEENSVFKICHDWFKCLLQANKESSDELY
ncbi:helix-turn-helix domain-containing protein [Jeotgalibacillus sp. ET6]|uniref:helix-turn-helix domain-containing protein n=1 Tax=Jeotgalibacillus sp. ET6 TaxID=3037260 RepID=UPI003FA5C903